jgi:hypothetical protein
MAFRKSLCGGHFFAPAQAMFLRRPNNRSQHVKHHAVD